MLEGCSTRNWLENFWLDICSARKVLEKFWLEIDFVRKYLARNAREHKTSQFTEKFKWNLLLLLYMRSFFTNIELEKQLFCSLRGLCSSILHEISFDTYRDSIFLSRNMSQERLLMQSMCYSFLFTKMELIHYLHLTCDEFCSI